MRILCFILVGAFLLSIAIAENGDSTRKNTGQGQRKRYPSSPSYDQVSSHTDHTHQTENPDVHDEEVLNPTHNTMIEDNDEPSAMPTVQYAEPGPSPSKDPPSMMILEPMGERRQPSWTDWLRDFFVDDSPASPGPLIGPINFPGVGSHVFIRQNEPIDDDTEHVVVHLVNRDQPIVYTRPESMVAHPLSEATFFPKDTVQFPDRYTGGSVRKDQLPYKYLEGSPGIDQYQSRFQDRKSWMSQMNSGDRGIKDKVHQYPYYDGSHFNQKSIRMQSQLASTKQNGQQNIVWSQPYRERDVIYGRNLNLGNKKGPVTFPANAEDKKAAKNSTFVNIKNARTQPRPLSSLQKNAYQNRTRATSEGNREGVRQDEMQRFKQPQNYLDEITALSNLEASRRHINRADATARISTGSFDASNRQPRNQFSAFKNLQYQPSSMNNRVIQPQARNPRAEVKGGIYIVEAPKFVTKNFTNDHVMHSIMSMTASQKWKNIAKKHTGVEAKKTTSITTTTEPAAITTTTTTTTKAITKTTKRTTTTTKKSVDSTKNTHGIPMELPKEVKMTKSVPKVARSEDVAKEAEAKGKYDYPVYIPKETSTVSSVDVKESEKRASGKANVAKDASEEKEENRIKAVNDPESR